MRSKSSIAVRAALAGVALWSLLALPCTGADDGAAGARDRFIRGLAAAEQAVIAADWDAAITTIDAASAAQREATPAAEAALLIRVARVQMAIATARADRARIAEARRILEGVIANDPQAGTGVEARLTLERQVVTVEAALPAEEKVPAAPSAPRDSR